jgi:hypothetical protein
MKKAMIVPIISIIIAVASVGCITKPSVSRKVNLPMDIYGNWIAENPPETGVEPGMPEDYIPPEPVYILTFTPEETFALNLDGQLAHGQYIISGTTIQLVPSGKNYIFEVGAKEKDDRIVGDNLVWVKESNPFEDVPETEEPPVEEGNNNEKAAPMPIPEPESPVPPPEELPL